ncbi:MAG: MFS family permease [Halieaceae bacterium]
MNRAVKANIYKTYTMGFFAAFMVVVPVFVPLLQGYGLSMAQVMQTQAMFALTVAICEVPSGYIADMWGRKNTIVLGEFLNAIGFGMLWWADSFNEFLLYEMILGVGMSMTSGADLALLYDSEAWLKEQGEQAPGPSRSLSRLISIEAGAAGIAGICAGVMLNWSMNLVVMVQSVSGVFPFLIALTLVEPPRKKITGSHREHAGKIFSLLLFGKPVVLWTAISIIAFGLMSMYAFWLYQKYWEFQQIPLAMFGYIWAGFALVVSVSARYAGVVEQKMGTRGMLLMLAVLPIVGFAGMAVFAGWLGVLFGLAIQVARGLSVTTFYDALNSRVDSNYRATMNSLVSLGIRGSFIMTGPALGYLIDAQGIRFSMMSMAVISAPILILVVFPLLSRIRRERRNTRAEANALVDGPLKIPGDSPFTSS